MASRADGARPRTKRADLMAMMDAMNLDDLGEKARALHQHHEALQAIKDAGTVPSEELLASAKAAMAAFAEANCMARERVCAVAAERGVEMSPAVREHNRLVRQGQIFYAVVMVTIIFVISRMMGMYG